MLAPPGIPCVYQDYLDEFQVTPCHTHDQPLRITNPKAERLPKSYICCIEFGNAQFKVQKSPVNWDYHELMRGLDVMITAPKELARLLETLKDKWVQTI